MNKGASGCADRSLRRTMAEGGPPARILRDYIEGASLCLAENVVDPPEVVADFLKGGTRDSVAFSVWLRKPRERIAGGKTDLTLETLATMNVQDMAGDVRAHSAMQRTHTEMESIARASEGGPAQAIQGVLTWSNRIIVESCKKPCENFAEIILEASCRGSNKTAIIYVRLVGCRNFAIKPKPC